METKSRYEVISNLESQKRDLIRERDGIDEQLVVMNDQAALQERNKEDTLRNLERQAEDTKKKIFMPFFTSKKSGSGIGLSLARQIMHLHKGTVSVKSKPDEGTIFTLSF